MLEMAYICGLHTIEEAHLNITRHSMSLFKYDIINTEERDLAVDMAILGMLEETEGSIYCIDAKVVDFLSIEERQRIDKEMEEFFHQND